MANTKKDRWTENPLKDKLINSSINDPIIENNYGDLNSISTDTSNRISEAHLSDQLFTEEEDVASQYLPMLLSPNENLEFLMNWDLNPDVIVELKKNELLNTLSKYMNINHDIRGKVGDILKKSKFTEGAYIELIIPEKTLDNLLNNKYVTKEQQNSSYSIFHNFNVESDKTKKFIGMANENKKVNRLDNLKLNLSDDLSKLLEPLFSKYTNDVFIDSMLTQENSKKIVNPFRDVIPISGNHIYKPMILTTDITKTKGKPLVMEISPASCIPIYNGNAVDNHLGYILLLDRFGNFINHKDVNRDTGYGGEHMLSSYNNLTNENITDVNKVPKIEHIEQLYEKTVIKEIKAKFKNSIYNNVSNITVASVNDVFRIMFRRYMSNQNIQMLYIPKQMVSYVAFKYRDNGTGESLREKAKYLNEIRSLLTLADIGTSIKNQIVETNYNIQLDDSVDVVEAMANLNNNIIDSRKKGYAFGVNSEDDAKNILARQGVTTNYKHKVLPNTEINKEIRTNNIPRIDKETLEGFSSRVIRKYGLSEKLLKDGYDGQFAISIIANDKLLATKLSEERSKFMEMITYNYRLRMKYDNNVRDIIKNLITVKDLTDLTKESIDITNTEAIVNYVIDNIHLSMPDLSSKTTDEMLAERFDKYEDNLEKVLNYMLSDEALSSILVGEDFQDQVEDLSSVLKASLMRTWIKNNNFLPEVSKLFEYNKDDKDVPELVVYLRDLLSTTKRLNTKSKSTKKKFTDIADKLSNGDESEESEEKDEESKDNEDIDNEKTSNDTSEQPTDKDKTDEDLIL